MTRVAYFAHTAEASGPNNSLRRLLSALDRRAFEPLIYFPAAGPVAAELSAAGEQCRIVPALPLQRSAVRYPRLALDLVTASRRLVARLKEDQVELVHTNTCVTPQPALAATIAGIPVVCHIRESLRRNRFNNLYLSLVLHFVDRVIAVSRAVREDVLSRTSIQSTHVEVIYNGLDLAHFDQQRCSPDAHTPVPDVSEGTTVIALPAFFLPHKGHAILLAAIARLVHEYRLDVAAWLIGHEAPEDGNEFTHHLRSCCAEYCIEDRVAFLGFRHDVPAVISAADIICVPSTYPDPLPNSVLEGMAARKPVVGSATGGIPELLDDGRAGILVPPGHAGALASALARAVRDRDLRETLGRTARARVERCFTTRQHADSVQQLYRSFRETRAGVEPTTDAARTRVSV